MSGFTITSSEMLALRHLAMVNEELVIAHAWSHARILIALLQHEPLTRTLIRVLDRYEITAAEEIEHARLQADVAFLLSRCSKAGSVTFIGRREVGLSSNSLVAMAYGAGDQIMPSDWSDYAACVMAVRRLPKHRRTPIIDAALKAARAHVESKYPRQEARAAGKPRR